MNSKGLIVAGALGALALCTTGAYAQDTTTTTTTQRQTTKTVNVSGSVVRYTPGQSIVIRSADNRETQYTIASSVDVPSDVAVGSSVTVYTDPGAASRVTRISVGPTGTTSSTQTTYSSSSQPVSSGPGEGQQPQAQEAPATEVVTVSGTVQAYQPGQSITLTRADGTQATYTVNAQSAVPAKLVTGKTVTVRTTKGPSPVVQRVTYTTTTTTTSK